MKLKLARYGLSVLLILAMVLPFTASNVAASTKFSDVDSKNVHNESIIELSNRGILKGFEDGKFLPEKAVTRGQAAKIIALSLNLDLKNVKNPGFKDVSKTNEYYAPIAALVEKKVFSGKGDGTFKPADTLSRAQMAKVITLAYGLPIQTLSTNPFIDVNTKDTWYTNYLHGLIQKKITTGTTKNTFSPYEAVRRGQLASFVVRAENALKVETPIIIPTPPPINEGGSEVVPPVMLDQVAPTNLVGVMPSANLNDGKITGVSVGMEYREFGTTAWTSVMGTEIKDLFAGEYEVRFAAKTGYNPGVIAKVIIEEYIAYPEGFNLNGNIGEVSSKEALIFALNLPSVLNVHLTGGFILTEAIVIEKNMIISEDISEQIFDFGNSTIKNIEIHGDDNTLKNVTIESLLVSALVFDLTLEDVKDTVSSTHTIEGGGNESIKLSADTVFKGEIRITAGQEVQIRSIVGSNAKIDGTILIDGNAPTKISAPVKNVVINSSQPVFINSTVDNLVARTSGTIKVANSITAPTIKKRIGVNMEIKNEEGIIINDVIFETILDTSELEWLILSAEDYTTNAKTEGYNGEYTSEAVTRLNNAISTVKETLANNTEIDTETQNAIDLTATTLKNEINLFKSSKIEVNRLPMYEKWKEADRIVNRIKVSETQSKYSKEVLTDLEILITEAEKLYYLYKVKQSEFNSLTTNLTSKIEELKESYLGDGNPFEESVLTLNLIGDVFKEEYSQLDFFPISENGSSIGYEQPNYTEEIVSDGMQFTITDINETEADIFYVVIKTNGYIFYEAFTPQQILNDEVRTITLDDTYNSYTVKLPNDVQESMRQEFLVFNVLDTNGKAMFHFSADNAEKVKSGTYNIQYVGVGDEISYGLFKEKVSLSKENSEVVFTELEMKRVDISFEQGHVYNYSDLFIAPLNFNYDNFDVIYSVKIKNNVVYLSKVDYNSVKLSMTVEKDGQNFNVDYTEESLDFLTSGKLEFNDNLKMSVTKRNAIPEITEIKITDNIFNHLDVKVLNSNLQSVSMFSFSNQTSFNIDALISLTVDGKKYTKSINRFGFYNLTLKQLIGEDIVKGDAKIEFSVPGSIIPIDSKIIDIVIVE